MTDLEIAKRIFDAKGDCSFINCINCPLKSYESCTEAAEIYMLAKKYLEYYSEKEDATDLTGTQEQISNVCDEIKELLIEKNRAYGDSAINPVRIFSKADAKEQILVRIDDKLSRVSRGHELGEDVVTDLIGYLVLYKICDKKE